MNTQATPFVYDQINLSETVMVDGVPHVTRRAIGEWLEYADAQKAIDNIFDRNPHLQAHSVPLNLRATDGKNYETFVYHPIGFLLIVMESGQPKAHAMKAAVAEFVWHFAGPRNLGASERVALMKLLRTLFNDLRNINDAFVRDGLLADLREVSLQLGMPLPDAALLGKDPRQLALSGV